MERLTALYAALTQINTAMVRMRRREELFPAICRILVEEARFKMAWIGWAEPMGGTVVPVASFGDHSGYLDKVHITTGETASGQGPMGTAIREGRTVLVNDLEAESAPWRGPARQAGFRASIALPVRLNGKPFGALMAYAARAGYFGEREILLLEKVADDISFVLDGYEREIEHQRAQAALAESEMRFRSLAEQSLAGIAISDAEGYVYANARFAGMFGYTVAEILRLKPGELAREEDRARVLELIERRRTGALEAVDYTFRGRRKDGSMFDVEVHGSRMLLGGKPALIAIVLDITERKQAERALRQREDELREAQRIAHLGSWWMESATNRVSWSEELYRMLELDPSRSPPPYTEHQRLFTAESWQRLDAALQHTLATGIPYELELETALPSGRRGWMLARGEPMRNEVGVIVGLRGVAQNITERRLAERRIREQAELLDKATEAIVVTDADNQVTYWSKGAERMLGWRAEEMLGRTFNAVLALARVAESAEIQGVITRDLDWRGEIHGCDQAGHSIILETSVTMLRDPDGTPTGRLTISANVTEKKRIEEQFLRVQRMESIGMLAAGIAHDLNNMLAPILMGVPLIRSHVSDGADLRLLDTLEICAERGAGLVRQILSFSHGIAGEPKLVQARHLVRDICTVIRETFPKFIVLEETIPSDLSPVLANPTQIHQIVLNLCVNARDAMPDGGTLRLRVENRTLDEYAARAIHGARAGDWLVISVEDTGVGMSSETLARIWEPFFTTKGIDKGTGLGLTTVRGIVENHGGFITVETQLGRGSTFRVYLPAAESISAGSGQPSLAPARPARGELILFADDEESIRQLGRAILVQQGYHVLTACDGYDAVQLFVSHVDEIKLVITDIDMPHLDGAAFAQVLRHLKPGIPILPMTGLALAGRASGSAPPFGPVFLTKPFTAERLLHTVQDLLPAEPQASLPAVE